MSESRITSPQNERLKSWALLQRDGNARRERGEFVIEGPRAVRTAIELGRVKVLLYSEKYIGKSGGEVAAGGDSVVGLARERGVECVELSMAAFRKVADVPSPQGLAAVVEAPRFRAADLFRPDALLLVAAGIQEPGNLGSMIRTCLAAGATGLVALPPSVDILHPRGVRGSAGAVLALPALRMTEDEFLAAAREAGMGLFAAVPRGGEDFRRADWSRPCACVVGSEAHGVSDRVAAASRGVTIPMRGATESLNAAAAAAILLFEATRDPDR